VGFAFLPQREEEAAASIQASPPPASVVVAVERTELDHHLRVMAAATAIAAILMMAGAAALAFAVIRRALSPLAQLASDVAKIDAATLDSRLPADRLPTELEPICHRLNELLSRLQGAFERERHFSADVAHELRTPVAELRTLAEVAVKWPTDDPETQRTFADALGIAEQMEAVVSGLLLMARCESGVEKVHREPIALEPFLREAWQAFDAQAKRKQLSVQFDLPPNATIECDRALLRIIVGNLLSNAAEYSPANGEVRISAIENARAITLRVANSTADLNPADLPHLFERFWRKTAARTSSTRAGLGLSISRAATQLLGSEFNAEIPKSGTFVVSLILPAS
jgi:two-component system sensor histidine kinase QseC